jgi:Tfp pilus assembly protein PilF
VIQAERDLQRGDLDAAREGFEEAVAEGPTDLRAFLGLGLTFELREEPAAAERAYRQALGVDPTFAEALNNLGALLREHERGAEAVDLFRRALESRTGYVDAHINLALTLDQLGRSDEAIEAYDAAIEVAPRDATLRANYGLCLLGMGDRERAGEELRRALPLARQNPVALQAIGNGLRLARRFADAVRAMEGAIEVHPQGGTPALFAELALAYLSVRDGVQAERSLMRALELDAGYATGHYLLGRVLMSRGACDEGQSSLRRYLRLEPRGDQAAVARAAIAGCGTP